MSGGILIHRAYLVWTTLRALPAHVVFAGCVARVPVSLWGTRVEGVFARRCVYVRNRSQPFVRGRYGRAYASSAKGSLLEVPNVA